MVWKNDQVSELETKKIIVVAMQCLSIEGDFVEMGCYKGDTSLLLAEVLKDSNSQCGKPVENFGEKRLWIYDSFEGLPEKTAEDSSTLGENFKGGELYVTKREVKERFLRAGLKVPLIKKAWFSELSDDDLPNEIAFAFLDGDFYESIRDSLRLVTPCMTNGSVVIVHDYNNPALPGVARAVDEWLKNSGSRVQATEIYQSMILVSF